MAKCISCNRDVSTLKNSVSFKCPNCEAFEILRCGKCRMLSIKYFCPNCKFSGP